MQYKKDIADDFKDGDGRKWISRHNGEDWAFLLKREFNEKSDLSITYDSHDSNAYYEDFYSPNGAFYDTNNHNVVATYNFRFNDKTSNQLSYSYIYFDYTGRDSTSSYKPRRTLIKTQRISDQFTRQINDKHTLVAGFEYTKDKVRNTYGFNGEPAIFKDIDNTSYYIQDEWRFADNWKLTGGVRHDNHSAFGNYTSPSVNLGYEFNSDTNMYVSYNKFFVAPNANELYSSYGDPNLKPETGHTSEIGINHKFNDTLVMTAHLFKRNTKDYIAYSAGRYRNVGNEKADGWDIQFRKKVSKDINAYIGYTHINVDPLTAGARSNERGYIPKGLWNIGVDYSKEKFDVSLLGRGIIDRPGPGIGVTNFPQSTYWLWDLGLNYRTSPTTKVFLKVNNIFDTLYAEHTNVSYGGAQAWWSMPGRSFTAGVQYTF
ncbi:MAG: TonB-dependent receptor [Sporomusaceae bacterium]|nr:TonB-dependent receptor [Sporomusaceae bacterium]